MTTLSLAEIDVHPGSGMDWNGLVFQWQGGFYRAISHSSATFYRNLLQDRTILSLVERGYLVESTLTGIQLDSFAYVLEHRKIPVVTYPCEWSPSMFKDAVRLIVEMEQALADHQLSNHDPHPWNILFDGARPVFVDLGAIMPAEEVLIWPQMTGARDPRWPAYSQFQNMMLNPLTLMDWGYTHLARLTLTDFCGVGAQLLEALDPGRSTVRAAWALQATRRAATLETWLRRALPRPLKKVLRHLGRASDPTPSADDGRLPPNRLGPVASLADRRVFLEENLRVVERLLSPAPSVKPLFSSPGEGNPPERKRQQCLECLSRCHPASLLDLGCGSGWLAWAAAESGIRTIACDTDEKKIDTLYQASKKHALPLVPVVMNIRSPTPGVGPLNRWLSPALARLRCEMVAVLGLLDNLVFHQSTSFAQLVGTLDALSSRWALVEFVAPDLQALSESQRVVYAWYTADNLVRHLGRVFKRIDPLIPDENGNLLYLCEKG